MFLLLVQARALGWDLVPLFLLFFSCEIFVSLELLLKFGNLLLWFKQILCLIGNFTASLLAWLWSLLRLVGHIVRIVTQFFHWLIIGKICLQCCWFLCNSLLHGFLTLTDRLLLASSAGASRFSHSVAWWLVLGSEDWLRQGSWLIFVLVASGRGQKCARWRKSVQLGTADIDFDAWKLVKALIGTYPRSWSVIKERRWMIFVLLYACHLV